MSTSRAYTFARQAEMVLAHLSERTDKDRGEVIRLALGLYWWAISEHDAGSTLLIRRKKVLATLPIIGEIRRDEITEVIVAGTGERP